MMAKKKLSKKKASKKSESFNKIDKYFLLTWKKAFVIVVSWFASVLIHNAVYGIILYFFNVEFEEPLFFILAVIIIPIYAIIVLVYSLIKLILYLKNVKSSS